jgi:hypothetical protein
MREGQQREETTKCKGQEPQSHCTRLEELPIDVAVRVQLQEVDEHVLLHVERVAGGENAHVHAVAAGLDDVAS